MWQYIEPAFFTQTHLWQAYADKFETNNLTLGHFFAKSSPPLNLSKMNYDIFTEISI